MAVGLITSGAVSYREEGEQVVVVGEREGGRWLQIVAGDADSGRGWMMAWHRDTSGYRHRNIPLLAPVETTTAEFRRAQRATIAARAHRAADTGHRGR